jgi:alpha-1,3-rhamnosyl/mannosyltransferase
VAGGAALLVDPLDTDAICDGLTRMLADEELRDGLAEKGLRRAAEMTWQRAAERTWAVYEEMLA